MRFVKSARIRFGHADPAGIAYYPRFFEWFHDAFEAMFEAMFAKSYAAVLADSGIGFPAVQAACEWRRPCRFGDLVDIEVFISKLSERSATFEYRVKKDGALLATASVKIAGMSMSEHKPIPFPEDMRTVFARYVEADGDIPDTSRLR
jgi:4-hydroxybenzoyl-CoA thioesterase